MSASRPLSSHAHSSSRFSGIDQKYIVSSRPVSAFRPSAPLRSATSVNWLGMTYLCASVWASTKAFFSSASFFWSRPDGLQVLGLVGVVGGFHLGQRHFFGGVVGGADLAGSLEGQVLEHVRQTALAGGVVHVAGVDKGGVAEDRRLRPFADDERQAVGQHLGGDLLLEALQDPEPALRQRPSPSASGPGESSKTRKKSCFASSLLVQWAASRGPCPIQSYFSQPPESNRPPSSDARKAAQARHSPQLFCHSSDPADIWSHFGRPAL